MSVGRSRAPLVGLLACILLAGITPGTGATMSASAANLTNLVAAGVLTSPTGLTGSESGGAATLTWTAAQPNGNGNGNGYAISGVNNGSSSTCPSAAASYTTYVGSTASTTYTDSSSSLHSGAGGTYVCYLVQTGYNPAGGPPWASVPIWTSTNTLASVAVQLPSGAPTISSWAYCDQDGVVLPSTADWSIQLPRYIIYAQVTGSGISSVSAKVGQAGSAPFATPALSASSGTCAGATYNYTSGLQTYSGPNITLGTNHIYVDIIATGAGGTAESNATLSGNVSVDNGTAQPSSLSQKGAGSGRIAVSWTVPTSSGSSGLAGYLLKVYSGTNASGTPLLTATFAPGTNAYTYQGVAGSTYSFSVENATNAGLNSSITNLNNITAPAALLVQQNSLFTASGGATSVATTWPAATTSGNLLVALVGLCSSTVTPTMPAGWILAAGQVNGSSSARIFYYPAAPSFAAGTSVTADNAGNKVCSAIVIAEFSGVAGTVDVSGSASGTGASMSVSSASAATQASDLAVAGVFAYNTAVQPFTQGTGWTDAGNTGAAGKSTAEDLEYQVQGAPAVVTATDAWPNSDPYSAVVVAFK